MKPLVSMRKALADPGLFGWATAGPSWAAWRTVLISVFGEQLTYDEREIWRQLTGRDHEPGERAEEALLLCGRRGGKSRAAAIATSYVAGLCDHSDSLVPGERALATIMAQTQKQATGILAYASAIFARSPLLSDLVINQTADTLELSNGIDLEVRPASFRSARGVTSVIVCGDEVAFWRGDESANADTEILAAIRPSLATTSGMLLLTSPYARKGEAWELYKRHYGPDGDPKIVVIRAPSRTVNPTLPQSVVDRALERDRAWGMAEYSVSCLELNRGRSRRYD